jgi:putative oxidoreductase
VDSIYPIAFLIGRIIVGLYYLYNAANHFNLMGQAKGMSGWAASKGVPMADAMILIAGVLLAIAGVTIITGFQPVIGVIALVLFFLPVTFKMHDFWTETDPNAKMNQMVMFSKNIALLGSALMFLAIPTPWAFSLGG